MELINKTFLAINIRKNGKFVDKIKNRFKSLIKFTKFENIIIFIMFLNSIITIISNNNLNLNEYYFSNITLTIKGTGVRNIFCTDIIEFPNSYYPQIIYINGELENVGKHSYNFSHENNSVELIWNNNINNSYKMFYNCEDIIEIDLSNFDASEITNMNSMFSGCSSLTSINFNNFDTSNVSNMKNMFKDCVSLLSLNVSNFDTSKVIWMNYMFYRCKALINLDLSNFKTSKVIDMSLMFNGCSSLVLLNLNNFNTSLVTDMNNMFNGCSSLISLNLSSFDTSKVKNMNGMFAGYSSSQPLNLSTFKTTNVKNMDSMFKWCSLLNSLDLSNFNTSKVTNMNNMFQNCISLEYINLQNFDVSRISSFTNFLEKVPENIVVCIDKNNTILLNQLRNKECLFISCSDDWKLYQTKIINKSDICIDNFGKNIIFKYEYNGRYYESCSNGNLIQLNDNHIIDSCICDYQKCFSCPNEPLQKNYCTQCNNNNYYYPIEKDIDSLNRTYFDCYKEIQGYYLDKNDFLFKKCFDSCETCEIKGDNITHNCLECNSNYPIEFKINNFSNCYHNCSYYHYFDKDNFYCCTNNFTCPEEYPYLIIDDLECSNKNINIGSEFPLLSNSENSTQIYFNYSQDNIIYSEMQISTYMIIKESKEETNEEVSSIILNESIDTEKYNEFIFDTNLGTNIIEIHNIINSINSMIIVKSEKNETDENKNYESILEAVEKRFTDENYNTSKLDKGEEEIIKTKNITITLTSTLNQKNNKNNNTTIIDLEQCEIQLKQFYNISLNSTLYIKKLDIIQEGMKIPKIEYDIYYNLTGKKLEKLNISICGNSKISLLIPLIINESFDKLNINSKYYKDLCYISKNKNDLDIPLKYRQNVFIENNRIVCQDDCLFSEYDYISSKVKCLCDIKESSSSFDNMNKNKTKILNNVSDKNNFGNFNLLVCYRSLINLKDILHNIGYIILTVIIIFHIFCLFFFYLRDIKLIKNEFDLIIYELRDLSSNKLEEIKLAENIKEIEDKKDNNVNNNIELVLKNKKFRNKKKKHNISNSTLSKKRKNKKNDDNNIVIYNNNIDEDEIIKGKISEGDSGRKIINQNLKQQKIIETENIKKYSDEEKNILSYKLAIEYDKRSFFIYYVSLLKSKHNLINLFINKKDYNSKIIQFDLFFIGFTIYYAVNTSFYNDETIFKVYESNGIYTLKHQILNILYSSLISMVLNIFLKILSLSNDLILNYKIKGANKINNSEEKKLKKKLTIRFISYFILSFIFVLFSWYFVSIFGAIYKNNQYHLLKNTLLSFGLSLFYPFYIYLLCGIFRFISLSDPKKKRQCLYNFCKIIQKI